MTRAVIFDLDSCLSAADEPGRDLYAPVFVAIREANRGSHAAALLETAFADMWRIPFDAIAEKFQFTPAMREAGWSRFVTMEVATPMNGYGDMDALRNLNAQRFLVTSGFRRLQESKVRALGITTLFTAIYIDAIDEPGRRGKQAIIEEILHTHSFQPTEVFIVGDSADSELAVGNRMGMTTVQTLRPGVPFAPAATYHIRSLHELPDLVR